jgi:hypothetical protein
MTLYVNYVSMLVQNTSVEIKSKTKQVNVMTRIFDKYCFDIP